MNRKDLAQVIQLAGQDELNAIKFADAIYDAIQSDTNAATKSDVKDLEIRMLNEFSKTQLQIQAMTREMNQLTFRLLGGMFGIIALFKIGEVYMRYKT